MKMKITCFTFVLAMALTLSAFAQFTPAPDSVPKPEIKPQEKESMMGKPTFQATSGDLIFSIWITTQEEHMKMMAAMSEQGVDKGMGSMKDKDKGMDKDMKGMDKDMKEMDKDMEGMDKDMKEMDKDMEGMDKNMEKDVDKDMNKDMKGMEKDMKGTGDKGMKNDSATMKGKGMSMDKATKEAMMAGTHHMMVEVKNTVSGKETNAISAKVELVSPTNKNSSVDLKMPMANQFGSGLTLDEKGEYQLTVSVLVGSVSKTIKLKYTVK